MDRNTANGYGLAAQPLQNGVSDSRLADAWFSRYESNAALATLGSLPAAQQQLDLLVWADQRRGKCAQRLEPAPDCAQAEHLKSRYILREALERGGAKIAILEKPSGQSSCTH
jgi:hypothetical protein